MDWEPLWRMAWAAALALPIGLDRELRGKPAGLRTHVVVATAAAALGYVSVAAAGGAGNDATRIAAQVVSGIGFMGAGIIFAAGGRVHGLTTAAALWSASAVGLCVGLSADSLAVALVVVTMTFLWPVDWLTTRLLRNVNRAERVVHLVVGDWKTLTQAHVVVVRHGGQARDVDMSEAGGSITARMTIRCRPSAADSITRDLGSLEGVVFAIVEDTGEAVMQGEGQATA
jgi:putative Mg2+ transporter-C (MgtC) family protein